MTPFFLQHGHEVEPLQLELGNERQQRKLAKQLSDEHKAAEIAVKLQQAVELAQAGMAVA